MRAKFGHFYLIILGLVALFAISTQSAVHATATFDFTGVSTDAETVTFTDDGKTYSNVQAGIYTGTVDGTATNLFCIDPVHSITKGDSYTPTILPANEAPASSLNSQGYYNGGLGSEINRYDAAPGVASNISSATQTLRAEEVSTLANDFLNDPSTSMFSAYNFTKGYSLAEDEAAVNLSIWDIVEDGGNGLGSGLFTASGSTYSTYNSLVNGFESVASGMVDYSNSTAYWIQAPKQTTSSHEQNYIYSVACSPAGVPEVSPLTIMSIGFGGILLALGIRRRKATDSA